jgi:hypothetical protein
MSNPTYIPIATATVDSATTSVIFSNIPNNYRHLILHIKANLTTPGTNAIMLFNSDSAANYRHVRLYGTGTEAISSIGTPSSHSLGIGEMSDQFVSVTIMDYAATNKHKSTIQRISNPSFATSLYAHRWLSTAAINSLSFFITSSGTWQSATFSVYGVIG